MKGLDRRLLLRGLFCCAFLATLGCPRAEETPTSPAWPQTEAAQFHLTTWTSRQGLPEDWIECITQTSDGYLWLGTPKGLIRFDGVTFVMLNEENCPAMKSTVCKALLEDPAGNLWVATKQGLLRFGRDGVERYSAENGLGGEETTSLAPGRDGAVWVGTHAGVTRWLTGRLTHFPAQGFRSPFVNSVLEDGEGKVWAGMDTGLYQLDPRTGRYTQFWGSAGPESGNYRDHVRCMSRSQAGGSFFGTEHGFLVWRQGQLDAEELGEPNPANRIKGLLEDRLGGLWAVIGYSLHRRQAGRFVSVDGQFGLTDAIVNVVYEDRQGTLWMGSRDGGLTRAKPVPARVFTRKDGLWNSSVRSVSPRSSGGVWLATASGKGAFGRGRFQRILAGERWTDAGLSAVVEDQQRRLWIGSVETGLFQCNPDAQPSSWSRIPLSSAACYAVLVDSRTNLWAGFSYGLMQAPATAAKIRFPEADWMLPGSRPGVWVLPPEGLSIASKRLCWLHRNQAWAPARVSEKTAIPAEYEHAPPPPWLDGLLFENTMGSFDIRALAEGPEGDLWIGTAGGGLERLLNRRFTRFTKEQGLPGDFVRALWTDGAGTVWIGTSAGLACARGENISSLAAQGGPLAQPITALVGDDTGCLWIGTDGGIYRFLLEDLSARYGGPAGLGSPRFTVLDETDGVLSTAPSGGGQPAACVTFDGKLWFATSHGLVQIDPPTFEPENAPVAVHIEDVRAENLLATRVQPWIRSETGTVPLPGDLTSSILRLPPGSGQHLEFRYTALDLNAPERMQFAYQLVGNDGDWTQAGNRRSASYTNLKPGRYRFQVSASDRHRMPRSARAGAALVFEIEPYLHENLWFRGAAILGLGLVMSGLVGWRWRDLRRRHALEQRLAVAEERSRIADDLHDQIGANLSRMAREFGAQVPGVAKTQVENLKQELRSVMSDLDQTVWLLQPEQDTLPHFADQLHRLADRWFAEGDIERRWRVPGDLPAIPLSATVRRDLLLFVKEALTNVLKHAAARTVGLDLSLDADSLTIVISDDGRGFDPENVQGSGHGLTSMTRRAERFGGTLRVETQAGAGTRLHLRVPLDSLARDGAP